jgi:hypothetical protein
MTVEQAIDAYLQLSKECFALKHKNNVLAKLLDLSKAKGKCDSKALEAIIKDKVAEKLGKGQDDALLLEVDFKCRV